MKPNQSPLDQSPTKQRIIELIQAGEFNRSIAKEVGTSEAAIRRFRQRHAEQIPGVKKAFTMITGDEATAATVPIGYIRDMDAPPVLDDPDKMLLDRNLDPEEWYIDAITVNEWDGPQTDGNIVRYYQAKFTAKRKKPENWLQPVRSDGWTPPKPSAYLSSLIDPPHCIVVVGDQQAPFYDKNLHKLFLQWLGYNRPQQGIILGDLIDFPDISRHPSDPDNNAAVQECLQVGYELVRDYVAASPNTQWKFIRGNHDQRLRSYILEKSPLIYGLHRATTDEEQDKEFAHSLAWLMRFDELGVELVDTNGTYEDAQVVLSKNLAVRHGWIVRQGSGASALKSLEQAHHSIVVGHTHRQSVVYHTTHDVHHNPTTLVGVEAGCMCQIDNKLDDTGRRFPSYGVYPNWQQGFAVIHLHQDGKFHVSLANYVNSTLLWNDQRYE